MNFIMEMNHSSSDRLEMNLMWVLMGAMFFLDVFMIYYHVKMHKRIKSLEELLKK